MAIAQGFEAQREPVGERITARIALPDDPNGALTGRQTQEGLCGCTGEPGPRRSDVTEPFSRRAERGDGQTS
jgi:hypothetical protein